jgi:hypothetical protein
MHITTPETPSRLGWSAPKISWTAILALAWLAAAVVVGCFAVADGSHNEPPAFTDLR